MRLPAKSGSKTMAENELHHTAIDWSLTTWEGARREQLRRWAELPLERIVSALEEMEDLANRLNPVRGGSPVGGRGDR
jgi:hypothetical protein